MLPESKKACFFFFIFTFMLPQLPSAAAWQVLRVLPFVCCYFFMLQKKMKKKTEHRERNGSADQIFFLPDFFSAFFGKKENKQNSAEKNLSFVAPTLLLLFA
jgi:hypothetical protein